MWLPFTEQHEQFRKTVRAFAEKELAPHAEEWETDECFPNWVFKRAGELGILGAHFPEEHGGMGLDYWFSAVKAEELPRSRLAGVTMGLLVQSDMATPVISDLGTPAQIEEVLKPVLAGEKVISLGVSEPAAGSDVAGILTTARKDGDDYVISGQKTFITNGTRADWITLLAKTTPDRGAHGCSFFLVPTSAKGFSVSKKLKKIGNKSSDTAELFLDEVRIPKRYLLGEENMGFMYLMQNFQSERLIGSVSALAGAFYMLEHTINYGRERVAFGKPIIKREVWQHKFVDLYTRAEAAKAFVYKCLDHYNEERYVKKGPVSFDTVKYISMSKVLVGDVVSDIMDTCLQFHGGWGYIEDFQIARAWRDQRLFRIGGGTTETMKYYIAKLMGF
ncbi:acyl-CoA dehydrogenase family protein [Polyangium spumosum]|uniref:Acyl-CoA dehydrogenase n=1 Tax=Polyangium spumosum TaxID=889282 RepID=A0A6N7PT17_9BACT|nr:acyl-CoA dehydrogenase family protein [Polyangium spumosum]MRG95342.1 acyl-CoA dehydrogenase [Polyangium spumosum]